MTGWLSVRRFATSAALADLGDVDGAEGLARSALAEGAAWCCAPCRLRFALQHGEVVGETVASDAVHQMQPVEGVARIGTTRPDWRRTATQSSST